MKQFVFQRAPLLLAAAVLGVGCAEILGLEPPREGPGTTSGGSSGATTGGNTTGGNSTGGHGGSTGGTGGCIDDPDCPIDWTQPCHLPVCSANVCGFTLAADDAQVECYDGPPGTLGVGACHTGTLKCGADGMPKEPCTGQSLPGPENCATPARESCVNGVDVCPTSVEISVISGEAENDVRAIQVSPNGDIYIAGTYSIGLSFGKAVKCSLPLPVMMKAGYVAKLTSAMECAWAARVEDDTNGVSLDGLALGGGKVWVTGSFKGLLNVRQLDGTIDATATSDVGRDGMLVGWDTASGLNARLVHVQGLAPNVGHGGIATSGDFVYGSFSFNGETHFHAGPSDVMAPNLGAYDIGIVKYDNANDEISWVKTFGSASDDEAGALAVQQNDLVVGGMIGGDKGELKTEPSQLTHQDGNEDGVVFKIALSDGSVSVPKGFGRIDGTDVIATAGIWPHGQDAVTAVGTSAKPIADVGCQVSGGGPAPAQNAWLRTTDASLSDCSKAVLLPGSSDASFVRVIGTGTTPIVGGNFNGLLFDTGSYDWDGFIAAYADSAGPAAWYLAFSSPGEDTVYDIAIQAAGNVIYVVGSCKDGMLNGGAECDSSEDGFIAKITP